MVELIDGCYSGWHYWGQRTNYYLYPCCSVFMTPQQLLVCVRCHGIHFCTNFNVSPCSKGAVLTFFLRKAGVALQKHQAHKHGQYFSAHSDNNHYMWFFTYSLQWQDSHILSLPVVSPFIFIEIKAWCQQNATKIDSRLNSFDLICISCLETSLY